MRSYQCTVVHIVDAKSTWVQISKTDVVYKCSQASYVVALSCFPCCFKKYKRYIYVNQLYVKFIFNNSYTATENEIFVPEFRKYKLSKELSSIYCDVTSTIFIIICCMYSVYYDRMKILNYFFFQYRVFNKRINLFVY